MSANNKRARWDKYICAFRVAQKLRPYTCPLCGLLCVLKAGLMIYQYIYGHSRDVNTAVFFSCCAAA
jgi:hypothetical protein